MKHARDGAGRAVLLWAAALPLSVAAVLSVWRIGADERTRYAEDSALVADSAASWLWRSAVLSARAPDDWSAAALGLLPAFAAPGYELVLFHIEPGAAANFGRLSAPARSPESTRPSARGTAELQPTLDSRATAALLSLDRSFAAWRSGRVMGLAPIKDGDQWDVIGAVAAVPAESPPRRFPRAPLAAALLAALTTFGVVLRTDTTRMRNRVFVFLPSLAFVIGVFCIAQPPEPSSFRFWTLVWFGTAFTGALIAASLAAQAHPIRTREGVRAWLFLAPSFAHLLLFSIGPILFSLFLSFHEWNLLDPARTFIGFGNYLELLGDAPFWRAVRNTALYVLFVPAGMVVALALALLLDRTLPGVRLLRAIFFLPYVTSFVAISLVWKWMFEPDVGLLNNALRTLGLPAQPWLSSPATALPSLMLMSIWMYAGYMMVLFLAGLQSIPESLHESARMDGANAWQRFRRITLPLLKPTVFFVLATMVIFMFQVFTAVYVMTEGGPLHATDVIVYHIYRNAWEYLRMGYASAMAWVLFAIVFVITLVQFRWLGQTRPQ